MSTTYEYSVEMTCGGCSGAITRILNKQKDAGKVDDFEVKLETKQVFVTTAGSSDDILEIIKKAGKATTFIGTKK